MGWTEELVWSFRSLKDKDILKLQCNDSKTVRNDLSGVSVVYLQDVGCRVSALCIVASPWCLSPSAG